MWAKEEELGDFDIIFNFAEIFLKHFSLHANTVDL
jgi:hypothetical protein